MSGNLISGQLFYSVATFLRWGIVVREYMKRDEKKRREKKRRGKKEKSLFSSWDIFFDDIWKEKKMEERIEIEGRERQEWRDKTSNEYSMNVMHEF